MQFIYRSILTCIRKEIEQADIRMRPVEEIVLSITEFKELEAELRAVCPHLPEFEQGKTPTIDGIPIRIK